MKYRCIFIATFSFFIIFNAFSQNISYRDIDFDKTLKEAKKSKQIIFIQLKSECEECDLVAKIGLSGKEVVEIYKNFISIEINLGTNDYKTICEKYRLAPTYPTSLFLNQNGDFLTMMYNKSTSFNLEYIKLAAEAMSRQNNPPFSGFTKKHKAGNSSSQFLKDFISELTKYNLETEDLLEEYVNGLTVRQLFSTENILFLMNSAPLINLKIYRLMRFDNSRYDSLFMTYPLKNRIAMNNRMIEKSRKKAFQDKDENYMLSVARFIQGTYSNDYQSGRKSRDLNMLNFYKGIKDSSKYIHNARYYYQNYFASLNLDSITKAETEDFIKKGNGTIIKGGNLYKTGNQLNELAWTVYEFSNDPEHLGMALKWSEKTLIYNMPPFYDTYAHILYKLGAQTEAIQWQQKAIELNDSLKMTDTTLRIELEKMKNGVKF